MNEFSFLNFQPYSFWGNTSLSDCISQQCKASSMVVGMMTFCFLPYQHQEQYKRRTLIVSDSIGIEKLIVWMCWRCISLAASLCYYRRQSATWLAFSLHIVIIIKELNSWRSAILFLPATCTDVTYFIFNIIVLWLESVRCIRYYGTTHHMTKQVSCFGESGKFCDCVNIIFIYFSEGVVRIKFIQIET